MFSCTPSNLHNVIEYQVSIYKTIVFVSSCTTVSHCGSFKKEEIQRGERRNSFQRYYDTNDTIKYNFLSTCLSAKYWGKCFARNLIIKFVHLLNLDRHPGYL